MKALRRTLLITSFLFSSFLNSSSVDVRSSYAADQPSIAATVVPPPAPKKKTSVTESGYPPMELLAATDFSFYPRAPCCPQFDTRFNMTLKNSYLYLSDSSDTPIQKISTTTGEITPLASWTGSPVAAMVHGNDIVWIEARDPSVVGGSLPRINRTSLDGLQTTLLGEGFREFWRGGSFEILVDDTSAYWVNAVPTEHCFPSGCFGGFYDWKIQKVPLAGGASVTLATVPNTIVSVARDDLFLYWTEDGDAVGQYFLKKVPLAGGAAEIVVDAQLNGAATGWSPTGNIVVDGGEIFFAAFGNALMKVPVSGGGVTILSSLSSEETIRKIVLDSTNLYWLNSSGIKQTPRNGGSSSILLNGLLFPAGDFMIHNGNVIWSDNADRHVMTGRINVMPLAGGQVTTLVSGLEGIRSFAGDDSKLYFVDGGGIDSYTFNGKIADIPWGGGPVTTIVSAVMADYLSPIAADDVNVYFGDYTGIKKVPIGGGVVDTLATGPLSGMAYDIATDGSYVYWLTDTPFPVVKRVPVDGGPTETIAPPRNPSGNAGARLVLAGDYLYWYEHGWSSTDAIMRVPIIGGPAETVKSGLAQVVDMAVDGTDIFYQEANAFNKISVNGGAVTNIGTADDGSRIALDDMYVYWGNYFWLQRASKSGSPATTLEVQPAVYALTADSQGIYWLDALDNLLIKIDHGSMDRFVNVYSPAFDNIWPIGSKQSIMWGFKNTPGTVKIDISRDGGATWSSLTKKGAANRGLFSWKVKGPQSDQSHIRVCISNQSTTMCDTSSPFTIQ
jgi:hypothetical protein